MIVPKYPELMLTAISCLLTPLRNCLPLPMATSYFVSTAIQDVRPAADMADTVSAKTELGRTNWMDHRKRERWVRLAESNGAKRDGGTCWVLIFSRSERLIPGGSRLEM